MSTIPIGTYVHIEIPGYNSYVDTLQGAQFFLKEWVEDGADDTVILKLIRMTEEEFETLREFEGF